MTASAPRPPEVAPHWDSADAARRYRIFCRRYPRYSEANAELIRHAGLRPGLTVLDLGAGLGGTTAAAIEAMGGMGRFIAVEPAAAMRGAATCRSDSRVQWHAEIPERCRPDRILCGASLWLLGPLAPTLARLRDRLAVGGALCFNIPALYLGEPDLPGGGQDPDLLDLPARLLRGRPPEEWSAEWEPSPDATGLECMLRDAGFRAVRWEFSIRLSQAAYRDWLKLPACSASLLPGLSPQARARSIDRAFAECDPESWRWERWRGWTAWAE